MNLGRIGWGAGGAAFLAVSVAYLFTGDAAVGIAFLALGLVFLVNSRKSL